MPCLKSCSGFLNINGVQGSMQSGPSLPLWPHLLVVPDSPNLFWFSCLIADVWMYQAYFHLRAAAHMIFLLDKEIS